MADLNDGDSIRIFGALARALNAAGPEPVIAALDELDEQPDDSGGGDAGTSANSSSRPDGRRVLSPPEPTGDGDGWSTPSLLDEN